MILGTQTISPIDAYNDSAGDSQDDAMDSEDGEGDDGKSLEEPWSRETWRNMKVVKRSYIRRRLQMVRSVQRIEGQGEGEDLHPGGLGRSQGRSR